MVRHQLPRKNAEAARDWRKAGIASYNPGEATQFPNICRRTLRRGSTPRGRRAVPHCALNQLIDAFVQARLLLAA
jgi:hypothetical protein